MHGIENMPVYHLIRLDAARSYPSEIGRRRARDRVRISRLETVSVDLHEGASDDQPIELLRGIQVRASWSRHWVLVFE